MHTAVSPHIVGTCALLAVLLTSCTEKSPGEMTEGLYDRVAPTAEEATPLMPGMKAPGFEAPVSDGKTYRFDPDRLERPVVLIFYRGGWCPYCNRHLAQLRLVERDILDMGYDLLFISADRVEMLRSSLKDSDVEYALLSDNGMTVARDYGVAFHVDDETVARYLNAGIDLEAASGKTHHILPVPSAFIIGRDGIIRFVYANPNYRVRVHPELLKTAARLALEE